MDEDCETILEGSALYKYLEGSRFHGMYETFPRCNKKPDSVSLEKLENVQKESIPRIDAELINMLLYSNLMLDEDASYLYSLLTTFKINYFHNQLQWIMLPGSLFLALSSFYISVQMNRKQLIPFVLGSTVTFILYVKKMISHRWQKSKIMQIIDVLNKIFRYIKKKKMRIYDLASNIITKDVLRTSETDPISNYYHVQMNKQITAQTADIILVLAKLIEMIRRSTALLVALIPTQTHDYVSLLSDEELGINYSFDATESVNIGTIDALKNVIILLRSEYLKGLGVCLSPLVLSQSHKTKGYIFKIIEDDLKICSQELRILKYQHYLDFEPKKFVQKIDSKHNWACDAYGKIRIFNSLLSDLKMESDVLESFLEENPHDSFSPKDIQNSLCCVEKKLSYCSSYFKDISYYFNKQPTPSFSQLPTFLENHQLDNCATKTKINVGFSDFTIQGVDNIYLCVNDKSDESGVDSITLSDDIEVEMPKLPPYVLTELKNVLISKKIEFQKRELEAVKRNKLDYEKYSLFLNEDARIYESLCSENPQKIKPINVMKSEMASNEDVSSHNVSFQKLISLKAANASLNWKKCQDEEIIYDGDSSDDQSGDD